MPVSDSSTRSLNPSSVMAALGLMSMRMWLELLQQSLDDDDVLPLAADLSVTLVDPDLAKPEVAQQRAAGKVLGEHARHQLPEAGGRRFFHQRRHGETSRTLAAPIPCDVHRELRDVRVAITGAVFRRRRKRNHDVARFDYYDRKPAPHPRPHIVGMPQPCLERRDAVGDPLV